MKKHEDHDEMLDRICAKKMSEGGQVSNEQEDSEDMADSDPREFDDLVLDDDLDFSLDSKNSGDELGNSQEDHDREDMVSRIARQRKMSAGKNPKPA